MSLECHWYYDKDYTPRKFGENRLISSCSHQNDHTGSKQITKSLTSTVLSKSSQCVSPIFNHWLVYDAVQINMCCNTFLINKCVSGGSWQVRATVLVTVLCLLHLAFCVVDPALICCFVVCPLLLSAGYFPKFCRQTRPDPV